MKHQIYVNKCTQNNVQFLIANCNSQMKMKAVMQRLYKTESNIDFTTLYCHPMILQQTVTYELKWNYYSFL